MEPLSRGVIKFSLVPVYFVENVTGPLKSDTVSEGNTCDVHGSQHARRKTSKEPLSAIKD